MRKHLNNPLVSGLLGVVALGVVILQLLPSDSNRGSAYYQPPVDEYSEDQYSEDAPAIASTFDPQALWELASRMPKRDILSRQTVISETEEEIDMTKQYASESLTVNGIWIQGDRRLAAIDGSLLEEGQFHSRAKLDRVEAGGVWILAAGETRFIQPGQSWTYQYKKTDHAAAH